jgi:translation initiation factor 4A
MTELVREATINKIDADTANADTANADTANTDTANIDKYPEIATWEDITPHMKSDNVIHILRGIYGYGFERPSPIQQKSILPMLDNKDLIAQAQSGTGKTGAFTVGCLSIIDTNQQKVQAILMSPTRELALQTYDVIKSIGTYMKDLNVQLCVGGGSVDTNIKNLRERVPQIVVGCPGRIHDMIRRNVIDTKSTKLLILDEADEMLSTGFKEQVYNIFQFLPKDVQLCFYSATIPDEITDLTIKFMRNPIKILIKSENLTLDGISQYSVCVDDDQQKYETLKDLFSALQVNQTIIYCNSVKRVSDLFNALCDDGFPVCAIHSGMEKHERTESYKEFKSGKHRVLVSSNVTARGIDVQQVSIVINFDIPKCVHTYLHRIGRSGRWGRKGVGINFVTQRDSRYIKAIETHYVTKINELPASFMTNGLN